MRIVSLACRAGMQITQDDVMASRTIAQLATLARGESGSGWYPTPGHGRTGELRRRRPGRAVVAAAGRAGHLPRPGTVRLGRRRPGELGAHSQVVPRLVPEQQLAVARIARLGQGARGTLPVTLPQVCLPECLDWPYRRFNDKAQMLTMGRGGDRCPQPVRRDLPRRISDVGRKRVSRPYAENRASGRWARDAWCARSRRCRRAGERKDGNTRIAWVPSGCRRASQRHTGKNRR
jgi:hypothetical protein